MTYFHPEQMPVLPARRREAARRQLEDVVKRSAKVSRRRSKPAVVLAAAVTIVLATGTVAYAIARYLPVTDKTHARCYTIAQLAPRRNYTTVAAPGVPGSRAQVEHARSACAALFRQGFLTAGVAGLRRSPGPGSHQVPPLAVCAMPDGSAAVIVGGSGICVRLGLSSAIRPAVTTGRSRPGTAAPIP